MDSRSPIKSFEDKLRGNDVFNQSFPNGLHCMTLSTFAFPTQIIFGAGARHEVAAHLQAQGVKRPVIVTDRGIAPLPMLGAFRDSLAKAGLVVEVFSDIWGNPTGSQVMAGAMAFKSHGADAVIGFGGGTALDVAKAVFADPELTLDLPARITAATGMDALTHNVESYLSPAYHPLCDGIALEGVRICAQALPKAVKAPRDLQARADMLMASMMGAIAFQKDLGATHSCAHALSTVADLHHGLANGIMIDHVMRFNQPAATVKMAEMARVAGLSVPVGASAEAGAAVFIAWLTRLKADVGLPAGLAMVGVKADQVDALVEVAINDICHQTNPRPCSRGDFAGLFRSAL